MSLKVLVLACCAACYAPDVPECTLACTTDTDCVAGQACTSDGYCAASAQTRCSQRQMPVDGAVIVTDGDGSGSDSSMVPVHVTIDGPGKVTTSTGLVCTSDCTYQADKGVPLALTATASSANHHFTGWTGACAAQPPLCHVTPTSPLTIGARFMGGD